MTEPITEESISSRLTSWNRESAEATARLARETCSLNSTVDQLETVYSEVIDAWSRQEKPSESAMLDWAAGFFERATVPYKLGREMEEIWRRQRKSDAPRELTDQYVEQHRIMHAFRRSEKKIAEYEARLRERDAKIEALKLKLEEGNGSERRRLKFWRR